MTEKKKIAVIIIMYFSYLLYLMCCSYLCTKQVVHKAVPHSTDWSPASAQAAAVHSANSTACFFIWCHMVWAFNLASLGQLTCLRFDTLRHNPC